MAELLTTWLLYFTSFFTLVNPLGAMPIFMTMTGTLTQKEKNNTARKASIAAFLTLIAFAVSGQFLFYFFGISVNSLRIVGGILFFIMGNDMLQARLSAVKIKDSEVVSYVNDISITPLAIPIICGPGAITNAIILMEDSPTIELKIILFTSIFAVIAINYLVMIASGKISKILGQTGNNVMMRLMGLIVMVIAVEFFFSGLKPILQSILK